MVTGAGRGRNGRRPTELQPRRLRRPRGHLQAGARGIRCDRPSGRHPRRPAGPQDPTRAVRRRAHVLGRTAKPSASPSTTARAPTTGCRPPTSSSPRTPRRATALLVDDGNVGLVVEHIDGNDVVCTVTEGGPVSNNKGLSLPGMNVSVPATVGEGHRGPRVRAAARRRPGRAVVRAIARRRRTGARGDGPRRPPGARDRQAGEARSHRQSRSHRAGIRRGHGGPRRPRRRAAAGRGAAGAEARHPNGKGERQTRHRRHPDAGVDDRELAADPRRGLRRRQRGARRRGRGDAVRRDVGRQVSARGGQDDGAHHLGGRAELDGGAAADARAPHQARCDLLCRARHRRAAGRQGAGGVHPVRRHGAPAGAAAHPAAAAGVHRRCPRCAASWR